MIFLETKGPGHTTAAGVGHLEVKPQLCQYLLFVPHCHYSLVMAMAMHYRFTLEPGRLRVCCFLLKKFAQKAHESGSLKRRLAEQRKARPSPNGGCIFTFLMVNVAADFTSVVFSPSPNCAQTGECSGGLYVRRVFPITQLRPNR
jgi:hypothetical protein